ncbi:Elongation factor 1-gamma [Psilocybe cubensis]|uniref:Elongation factor 1-gamma n=2 Tax=Psilocybe cubensis TaxID=181762 RepID=A0ACB8GN97_PSICU|nr:Elongation factor 1-gamma [Psilocybe cubensis]KAH9476847.1 Elongation factor 1-gamma [Psilocybe cubensis]
MAPAGTLWTTDYQAKGKIIKAVAALSGVEIALPAAYEHMVDNKKPEFLSKFPHGKIPAWESANGFKLFEGTVIARYLASVAPNSGLLGGSPEDAALVDQWIHLTEAEVDTFTDLIRGLCVGLYPYNKATHTTLVERQTRTLNTLEAHLATRTFFVGERITLADLTVAGLVQKAVGITIDAALRAKLPNLIRHLETIVNQPKLKAVFGETSYVDKAIQFTPPAKEKKEAKPAAAPAPKAEKKPKAKEDDDEDDNLVPAEPKVKNPLDDLPKSSFNLEDWKRAYSNKETRGAGGSIEWFYENFDYDGFSVWRVDFKYNDELTQTFMSSNQIGGFFNRLEASRKYVFGSLGVLGTTGDSAISGIIIARGQDIIPVINVAPDYESYSYTKLDVKNSPADKAFFEAALAWDLEIDGKKWVDGKNLK